MLGCGKLADEHFHYFVTNLKYESNTTRKKSPNQHIITHDVAALI